MSSPSRDLLLRIARCPVVTDCVSDAGACGPCSAIVATQKVPLAQHQVPELWSGHLDTARILFHSSNPSIDEDEYYPSLHWADEDIVDYFANRFDGGKQPWIKDGMYSLLKTGVHRTGHVRFWAAVRQRAAELLEQPVAEVRPGVDYALSEVVHCKSRSETGVAAAVQPCTQRYLVPLISAATSPVIVCLGAFAANAVRTYFEVPAGNLSEPMMIGDHPRTFAFLPHPAAFVPKKFATCFTPDELRRVRQRLRDE